MALHGVSKWNQIHSGPDRRGSFSIRERSARINWSDVSSVVSNALASAASSVCPSRSNPAIRVS